MCVYVKGRGLIHKVQSIISYHKKIKSKYKTVIFWKIKQF